MRASSTQSTTFRLVLVDDGDDDGDGDGDGDDDGGLLKIPPQCSMARLHSSGTSDIKSAEKFQNAAA